MNISYQNVYKILKNVNLFQSISKTEESRFRKFK